jgi:hypothetical protein
MSIKIGDIDDLKAKVKEAFNKVLDEETKDMYIKKIDCITPAMAEKIKDIFYKKIKKHNKYKKQYNEQNKQKKEGGGKRKKRKTRKIQKGGFFELITYTCLALSALSILCLPVALVTQCIYRGFDGLRQSDQLEGFGVFSDEEQRKQRRNSSIIRGRVRRIKNSSKSLSRMSHGDKLKFIFKKNKMDFKRLYESLVHIFAYLNDRETIITDKDIVEITDKIRSTFSMNKFLYYNIYRETLHNFLEEQSNSSRFIEGWQRPGYVDEQYKVYQNLPDDHEDIEEMHRKVNEKIDETVSDIENIFGSFIGQPNYTGSSYTLHVTPIGKTDDPDEVNYEFTPIDRDDGKENDEYDELAIQRAINIAQISNLAGQGQFADGSLPGDYDDDGNFIPDRQYQQQRRMRYSEDAAIIAENAYGEAAESYGVRRRNISNPDSNVGYMDMNQYNEERSGESKRVAEAAEDAAIERGGISFGTGLRRRYGHTYEYQGGKKKHRRTRRHARRRTRRLTNKRKQQRTKTKKK